MPTMLGARFWSQKKEGTRHMTKPKNFSVKKKRKPRRFITVLAEPASTCNLGCEYCYKGRKKNQIFMSKETTEKMLSEVIYYNESKKLPSLFVWHGGEPTIMGAEYYKGVLNYIKGLKCSQPVNHTVQTNGTLLTDNLIDLFVENNISISVSLDGPEKYHNKMRPYLNGKPTYKKIMEGLTKSKEKGLKVGILMSISNDNLHWVKDMFNFCRENKFAFGLNPVTDDLHSDHKSMVKPENYLKACLEAFDLWFFQKDYAIQANPGWGVTSLLLSKGDFSDCSMSENCQMYFVSIGPEGDVYPCNRFYGVQEYKYGNIHENSFKEIMNCDKRRHLLERCSNKIEKCKTCSIEKYCNGGCLHHAAVHNRSLYSQDHLCIVYQGLINHAVERLNHEL